MAPPADHRLSRCYRTSVLDGTPKMAGVQLFRRMPSLVERLNTDLKDAMRAGDAVRRDEIRGLIAMLKTEQQSKLTRTLGKQGLILHGDNAQLSPEQQAEVDRIRATNALSDDDEQAILLQRVKQHRQSIEA